MNSWTIEQISEATGGEILSNRNLQVQGFSTDTRGDLQDRLFIALRGDQFDAHQFLEQAMQKNAACLLVDQIDKVTPTIKSKASVILVPDTLKALQDLARWHRGQWSGVMIAITGSSGKTSTKEFMAKIIETTQNVFYSKGSFNNHWGVPLSLLQLESQHQVALIEMGMNHFGEITQLMHIATPTAVVCTMIGSAHIEHFGSVEKIAVAKEEIYLAANPLAIRIYNLDQPLTGQMYEKSQTLWPKCPKITFSETNAKADINLKIVEMNLTSLKIQGHIQGVESNATIPVFGKHNLVNLMAAAAGALAAGLKPEHIWKGFLQCQTAWGRNQLLTTENRAQVLFDAYNANPDSMKAVLENVRGISVLGNKIGVFGQMLEMGTLSAQLHEELGQLVGASRFNEVFFYGDDYASFAHGYQKTSLSAALPRLWTQKEFTPEFAQQLAEVVKANDLVVIKGSRGMKMERMLLPLKPLGFDEKK